MERVRAYEKESREDGEDDMTWGTEEGEQASG